MPESGADGLVAAFKPSVWSQSSDDDRLFCHQHVWFCISIADSGLLRLTLLCCQGAAKSLIAAAVREAAASAAPEHATGSKDRCEWKMQRHA